MQSPYLKAVLSICLFLSAAAARGQHYLSEYDSTLFIRDTARPILKRLEHLHFSGYIQPQFQAASARGAATYAGGNFAEFSASRFQLRRARIKVDYILPAKGRNLPAALFTFQYDITERGAFARDVFLRLYEPKTQKLSLFMGLLARPFGYEVNLSSAYRESPERGRMSQVLMPAERDLGAMISFESKKDSVRKPLFRIDAGVFNGPGLSAPADFDSYKDLIARITLKPYALGPHLSVGAGLSLLRGGWMQVSHYRYETVERNGVKLFGVDSAAANAGAEAPRHYYGADVQLIYTHRRGRTELRAEYWRGTQPGTATTTVNPGSLPLTPTYIRKFDGAFLYFIQSLGSPDWELVAKYDWYDPNRAVSGREIGGAGAGFTAADVRYGTLGFGINYYMSTQVKVLAYYEHVRNETTALTGYTGDQRDDVFTLRMQLRF